MVGLIGLLITQRLKAQLGVCIEGWAITRLDFQMQNGLFWLGEHQFGLIILLLLNNLYLVFLIFKK